MTVTCCLGSAVYMYFAAFGVIKQDNDDDDDDDDMQVDLNTAVG